MNEDGTRFLTDEDFLLAGQLMQIGNTAHQPNFHAGGFEIAARQRAVVDWSVRVRNEVARCEQGRRRIELVDERRWHRAWRRCRGNGLPPFDFRERAIEIVNRWRATEVRFGGGGAITWQTNDLVD